MVTLAWAVTYALVAAVVPDARRSSPLGAATTLPAWAC